MTFLFTRFLVQLRFASCLNDLFLYKSIFWGPLLLIPKRLARRSSWLPSRNSFQGPNVMSICLFSNWLGWSEWLMVYLHTTRNYTVHCVFSHPCQVGGYLLLQVVLANFEHPVYSWFFVSWQGFCLPAAWTQKPLLLCPLNVLNLLTSICNLLVLARTCWILLLFFLDTYIHATCILQIFEFIV